MQRRIYTCCPVVLLRLQNRVMNAAHSPTTYSVPVAFRLLGQIRIKYELLLSQATTLKQTPRTEVARLDRAPAARVCCSLSHPRLCMGGTSRRVLEPFAASSYTTDLVAVPMYVNTASDRLIGWYMVQSPTVCDSTTSPPQPQLLAGRLVDRRSLVGSNVFISI